MEISLTLAIIAVVSVLVFVEGIHRVTGKISGPVMAGIWLGVGILLILLTVLSAGVVHVG